MARFGPVVLISLVLVLLDLGAWCVLLGGAASLQKDALTISTLLNSMTTTLTTGDLFPISRPGNFISYEWFKAILQVLVLLICLGVLATGQLHRYRASLIGLLAVATVLWCDAAQTFYYLRNQVDAAEAVTGKPIAMRVRTWWAGTMMSAALNFLLIITLGINMDDAYDNTTTRGTRRDAFPDENKLGGNANGAHV